MELMIPKGHYNQMITCDEEFDSCMYELLYRARHVEDRELQRIVKRIYELYAENQQINMF
jgi:hypothetical protein